MVDALTKPERHIAEQAVDPKWNRALALDALARIGILLDEQVER